MITLETYELLNSTLHRISRLIGKIVSEKETYNENVKCHIANLSLAKQEIYELINQLEDDKDGNDKTVTQGSIK